MAGYPFTVEKMGDFVPIKSALTGRKSTGKGRLTGPDRQ
jgi:hypothetical protein